ncbi:Protein Hook 3 [Manis pentadactyla]|nr:Protein Hook 3 [Manis pentadactyla]
MGKESFLLHKVERSSGKREKENRDPAYCDENWLNRIKTEVGDTWKLKISNLKKILKGILDYNHELKKTSELNEALSAKEEIAQRCHELDMQKEYEKMKSQREMEEKCVVSAWYNMKLYLKKGAALRVRQSPHLDPPEAGGGQRSPCRSVPGGGDRPGLQAAAPAGLELWHLQPAPSGGATGNPDAAAGLPSASAAAEGHPRNAWGNLPYADSIAKAVESSAEKRLPLRHICGGGSRAGPASEMKATATALRAGRLVWCTAGLLWRQKKPRDRHGT